MPLAPRDWNATSGNCRFRRCASRPDPTSSVPSWSLSEGRCTVFCIRRALSRLPAAPLARPAKKGGGMKIGYLSAALAVLLVGALPALPVMAQTKTVIKYAIVDADGPLPAAQALHTFQRYVEFASDGKIEV